MADKGLLQKAWFPLTNAYNIGKYSENGEKLIGDVAEQLESLWERLEKSKILDERHDKPREMHWLP